MQVSQLPHTFQTAGPFNLGGGEIIVIAFAFFGSTMLFVPAGIFYILTLRNALWKCAPESRTMRPGQLWLLLIPLFNLGWHFVVVQNMAESLRNEFVRRSFPNANPEQGQSLGLAMCILLACSLIPLFGLLLAFAGFICWIVYWVKIADYSKALGDVRHETLPAI